MSFRRPVIIRPPSEWKSYFLPLTSGCSNNSCAFCNYYGSKLQLRGVDEVKKEIDALALLRGKGIYVPGIPDIVYEIGEGWDGKTVFLQDGDALVYPVARMKEVLKYLNLKLPSVERVDSYATAQDILRIAPDDLKEMRDLKLGILYTGLESGSDKILRRIAKGANSQQMIEACKKVREAGILASVTVILGLGGVDGSEEHALATARVLHEMDPDFVGALTLTLVQGTPLYREWKQGDFSLISPLQSLKELLTLVENSGFTNCFFSSMHASNYFAVRGLLPRDKDRMVGQLNRIIEAQDASLLRPEFLRGL